LGGEPEAEIHPFEVNTTLKNLTEAQCEENYEIESMYPRFLAENRKTDNSAARTFTWALEGKKTHARLLQNEIQQIREGKASSSTSGAHEFHVRPVCGYISKTPEPERCWACNHFCKSFEVIR